jgi:hypothetical protein
MEGRRSDLNRGWFCRAIPGRFRNGRGASHPESQLLNQIRRSAGIAQGVRLG